MVFLDQLHDHIYHHAEWRIWAQTVDSYTAEEDPKFGCNHGIEHWLGVSRIAKDFARRAGGNHHEVILADIAGLLHDCGMICGEKNHAENGARIARCFLKANYGDNRPLSDADIEIICHAIAHHSDCKEINNVVDAALVFADKIELGKHRIRGKCYNDIQVCQSKIDRIEFKLTSDVLAINYVTDEDFDYDFFIASWPKSYEIPTKVATWLGKGFVFFVNNKRIALP